MEGGAPLRRLLGTRSEVMHTSEIEALPCRPAPFSLTTVLKVDRPTLEHQLTPHTNL